MIKKEKTKFEVALSEIKNFLTLKSGNKEIEKEFFNQIDPITCDTQTRVLFQFDSEVQIQKVEVFCLKDEKLFSHLNQLTCDSYYLMNRTQDVSLASLYEGFEKGSQSESVVDGLQLYLNKQIKRFLEEPTKYFLSERIGFSSNFLPKEVIPEIFEQFTKDQFYKKTCEWFEYSIKKKIKEGKSYKDYNLFAIWEKFNPEFISVKEELLFKTDIEYGERCLPKFLYYFVDKKDFYSQFRKLFAEHRSKDSGDFYTQNVLPFTSVIKAHFKELVYSEIDTEVAEELTAFVAEVIEYIYSTDEYLHDFVTNDEDDVDDRTWTFLQFIKFNTRDFQEEKEALDKFVKLTEMIWNKLLLNAKEKGEFLINISKESLFNIQSYLDHLRDLEVVISLISSKEVKVHLLVTEVVGFTEFDDIETNRPSCQRLEHFFTTLDRLKAIPEIKSEFISLTATEEVMKSLDFYEEGVRQGHLFEYYFSELFELQKRLNN